MLRNLRKTTLLSLTILSFGSNLCQAESESTDLLAAGNFAAFQENSIRGWVYTSKVNAVDGQQALTFEPEGDGKGSILVNGKEKNNTAYLLSKDDFQDVRVQLEFLIPKGSNSGIYLMGRYEIQIFDSYGAKQPSSSGLGGLYQRWDPERKDKPGFDGVAPRLNASKAPGQWQTLDITFRAPRFNEDGAKTQNALFEKVFVNGQLVHENQEASGPTRSAKFNDEKASGPVMVQGDHGPIAIRKFLVTPL
ncbi:DUF1080 domain-containing protein [Roseibacillus persicicus]|uniref:3-keto-disaccharide hydrolase n=1 Tax=Roseibacillus persicicus TaxID=454148 RepID=UPI00398B7682